MKKLISFLILFLILINSRLPPINAQTGSESKIYLPIILNKYCNNGNCKFIGIYMNVPMWNRETVLNINKAEGLSQIKHSVIGWAISLQNNGLSPSAQDTMANNFFGQLEALWEKGYISFVNISSEPKSSWTTDQGCPFNANSKDIAEGKCDISIDKMAELYKKWIDRGYGRKAFIAPFPEMNGVTIQDGPWTVYGGDPENFKKAFERIQQRFNLKGISNDKVWWVFAPNGWHDNLLPQHAFENYYPGDHLVDVVSFSSYNFGYCWKAGSYKGWFEYNSVFKPYIDRFSLLAPTKPIIISQTGVTAERNSNEPNYYSDLKNIWLKDSYQFLTQQTSVLGVLYFDIEPDCKWSITNYGDTYKEGYFYATSFYQYLNTGEIEQAILNFTSTP
jgi:hypothetical protein